MCAMSKQNFEKTSGYLLNPYNQRSTPTMGIKYEDLLLSSKFFYTEGSEDSKSLFPDEIKEYGNIDPSQQHLAESESRGKRMCTKNCWDPDDLDVYLALESACGDPQFLV